MPKPNHHTHCGIDAVEIARFATWHTYSTKQLCRVFSLNEIAYCIKTPARAAERFAARFAAKEALFKALSPIKKMPLLKLFTACQLHHNASIPYFIIDWQALEMPPMNVSCSITHSSITAIAMVIVS